MLPSLPIPPQIPQALLTAYNWLLAHRAQIITISIIQAGLALGAILLRFIQGNRACHDGQLFQIAVPQGAVAQPFAAEQMFATLHGLQEQWWRRLVFGLEHITLELVGDHSGIRFFLWVPARIAESVVQTVHSAYEQADIRRMPRDYLLGPGTDGLGLKHEFPDTHKYNWLHRRPQTHMAAARLTLLRPVSYPIKTLREFDKTDPLAGLTAAMSGLEEGEGLVVQLLLQPGGSWELQRSAHRLLSQIERGRSMRQPSPDGKTVLRAYREYTPEEQQTVKAIGGKHSKLPFRIALSIAAFGPSHRHAYSRLRGLAAAYNQFNIATLNGWQRRNVWWAPHLLFLRHLQDRAFPLWGTRKMHHPLTGEHDVLMIEELSSLWHLPHPEVVETPGIVWSLSRVRAQTAGPATPNEDLLTIGRTTYHGENRPITIPVQALFTHMSILGLPGAGKSTLLALLALECIRRHISVILLDPHGDLCENLLAFVPPALRDRVIYFNPGRDLDQPMGLNLLELETGRHPAQVKSEVVTLLTHLYSAELIGPRSSMLLNGTILSLIELDAGMTLLEIDDLLSNEDFRAAVTARIHSDEVRKFWEDYFSIITATKRAHGEVIGPVMNKISVFAMDSRVANIIGQSDSSFSIRGIMDSGQALVCNLSQGRLGVDNCRLLGGTIASLVIQAALAREDTPEADRYPAVLIADEFHIFVGPAFAKAMAQVRKYRLGLVLASQWLSQMINLPEMQSAFLACPTLAAFKVSSEDAVRISTELTGFYQPEDLIRMGPHQLALRVATGHEIIPFSGETVRLEDFGQPDPTAVAAIREHSRATYGRAAKEVAAAIARRPKTFHLETAAMSTEQALIEQRPPNRPAKPPDLHPQGPSTYKPDVIPPQPNNAAAVVDMHPMQPGHSAIQAPIPTQPVPTNPAGTVDPASAPPSETDDEDASHEDA